MLLVYTSFDYPCRTHQYGIWQSNDVYFVVIYYACLLYTSLCALAAAYAAFRLHGGVAATAHLDGPQWTGIFTHTAGDTPRPIYGGQFF